MWRSSSTAQQPFVVFFSFQNPSETPLPELEHVITTQVSRKKAAWGWENRGCGVVWCVCTFPVPGAYSSSGLRILLADASLGSPALEQRSCRAPALVVRPPLSLAAAIISFCFQDPH